jgi:GDP/UDP-N,N'-diacetylbacillosamine 2-epimerase (hydrolysing)
MYSPAFKAKLGTVRNPYGDGGASERVLETLAKVSLAGILKKSFYNLPSL